jgi:hypothetical protein
VPAKTDAQGVGSATTYLRRYSLASVCGIAQEDDDGNSAAHNGKPAPVKSKPEGQPTSGVWEALSEAERLTIEGYAVNIREYFDADDSDGMIEYLDRLALGADDKAALWTRLDSKVRTAIKKELTARKEAV